MINPSAFPIVIEGGEYSGLHSELERGMTLRDYFAAHAPPVPEGWKPFAIHCDVERPKAVDVAASNDRLRRLISDYRRDPCFDLEGCGETADERRELRAFSEAQNRYADECEDWRRRNEIARLVAWRYVYADAMLAARDKPLTERTER